MSMTHLRKYILCLSLVMTIVPFLFSQDDAGVMEFRQYKMSDGLQDNYVLSLLQDQKGYMWVGTSRGLSRFDGISFTNADGFNPSFHLGNRVIFQIMQLTDSLIGVVTDRGCYSINIHNLQSGAFLVSDSTDRSGEANFAKGFTRLGNGNYLVLSRTGWYTFNAQGGLIAHKEHAGLSASARQVNDLGGESLISLRGSLVAGRLNKTWELRDSDLRLYTNKNDHLFKLFTGDVVFRKKINPAGYLFLKAAVDSVFYLNDSTGSVSSFALPFSARSEAYFSEADVYDLDRGEYALLCADAGFYRFTVTKEKQIVFLPGRQCASHYCRTMFRDKDLRIWVGAVDGLLKQKNRSSPFTAYPIGKGEKEEIVYNSIFVMNNKLFVTSNSAGSPLQVLDLSTKALLHTQYLCENGETPEMPYEMQSYYKDTLWFSGNKDLLWLDVNTWHSGRVKTPSGLSGADLVMLPAGKDGTAWMSSVSEQCYICYNVASRTFSYYTKNTAIKPLQKNQKGLVVDAYGDVWFYGEGMQRWNSTKKSFDTLVTDFGEPAWQASRCHYIAADSKGTLWISMVDKNFIKYDIKSGKSEPVDLGKYAPFQFYFIFSKLVDNYHWIGSVDHLLGFNASTGEAVIYPRGEDIPLWSSDIYCDESTGQRYITAGGKQLLSFTNVPLKQVVKPVLLEYLSTPDTVYHHPGDTIRLSYLENTLNIKFTVLDFDGEHPAKFMYSIDGRQASNAIVQTELIFLYDLSPGWHRLSVRPMYALGKYRPLELVIYICPPFWKTVWFRLLATLLLLLLVGLVIRLMIARIKKQNNLVLQLKEFEIRALHAQMNPHFIFNCLNGMKGLIIHGKIKEASGYMNSFAKLVRLNLEHSRKPFITLRENIEYLHLYLEAERLRFSDFTYDITLDEQLDAENILVIPMLLQPIVENAIWHGLQAITTQRILHIRCEKYGAGARFVIDDNGIGINSSVSQPKPRNKTSVGMDNVRERISLFNQKYKLDYRLEVRDKSELVPPASGTRVSIYFNIRSDEDECYNY